MTDPNYIPQPGGELEQRMVRLYWYVSAGLLVMAALSVGYIHWAFQMLGESPLRDLPVPRFTRVVYKWRYFLLLLPLGPVAFGLLKPTALRDPKRKGAEFMHIICMVLMILIAFIAVLSSALPWIFRHA